MGRPFLGTLIVMEKDFAPSLGFERKLVDYGTVFFSDRRNGLSSKCDFEVEVTGLDGQVEHSPSLSHGICLRHGIGLGSIRSASILRFSGGKSRSTTFHTSSVSTAK